MGSALSMAAGAVSADIGVDVRVGTLGTGVMLSKGFGESFSVGLALNTFDHSLDKSVDSIDYDFDLDFKTVGILANWHPFSGSFRLTAGVYQNDNEMGLSASLPAGEDVGGYTTTGSETLAGKLSFASSATYLGIGWGSQPTSSFGMNFDIGALYQGSPELKLTGTGIPAGNVETERQQAEDDLKSFKWYPVISAGLYFRF
jgi:hypothetical protein